MVIARRRAATNIRTVITAIIGMGIMGMVMGTDTGGMADTVDVIMGMDMGGIAGTVIAINFAKAL